ncbi:MAG: hypothetical protein K1X67_09115 [Fimbriimonadaceae bacterium]|nr:hypothetical protein [Fimbriimonadaceae bacterium]
MGSLNRVWFAVVVASAASVGYAQNLKLAVTPVFEGMRPSQEAFPILVEVANEGPDARGMLTVTSGTYVLNYPVELPRGSRKGIPAFPIEVSDIGEIDVRLVTDQGDVRRVFRDEDWHYGQDRALAMITDSPGLLTFVRQTTRSDTGAQAMVSDSYVSAESAPDRPVGYSALSALVLGDGAERLSDKQVDAIKVWMLAGGKLLFVGGASSPVLADSRWKDTLPVTDLKPEALSGVSFAKMSGTPIPETVQCMLGTPVAGAIVPVRGQRSGDARPLIVTKRIGLGTSIYLAFNLFEPPLSRWEGRRGVLLNVAQPIDRSSAAFIQRFVSTGQDDYTLKMSPSVPTTVPAVTYDPYAGRANTGEDPFQTSIPPTEKVAWILVAYFVAVVPLNFLVLRRLKKVEWAWVTAPLISLGFGAYFFSAAGSLYSAKLSRSTSGILIGAQGFDQAEYIGRTQMYFPRGGRYDLKLTGVDQIRPVENLDYYYGPRRQNSDTMRELNATDHGEVKAPALGVGNLAFREFTYRQVFPNSTLTGSPGSWFTLKGSFGRTKRELTFTGTITNSSPFTVQTPVLQALPFSHALGQELKPGQTLTINAKMPLDVIAARKPDPNLTVRGLRLEGTLRGLEGGPIVGNRIQGAATDFLAYSFALDLPKELQ